MVVAKADFFFTITVLQSSATSGGIRRSAPVSYLDVCGFASDTLD